MRLSAIDHEHYLAEAGPWIPSTRCYFDGKWVAGESDLIPISDPATMQPVAAVETLSEAQIDQAIEASVRGFQCWRQLSAFERGERLASWYSAVIERRAWLARLLVLEQGKPLSEALHEIDYAASFLRWYSGEATRIAGEAIVSPRIGAEAWVVREPVGPVVCITPWNFPSAMIARKAAAALAAGCSTLVLPSLRTPLSALALAACAEEAGITAGAFNVVLAEPVAAVEKMVRHPSIGAVSFTGSTAVGREIAREAAFHMKRLVLELGGHAPVGVFADTDLDEAVEQVVSAKFTTAGQDCLAANRIYVERPIYQEFVSRFAARAERLVVGPGWRDGTDIGPLMHCGAVDTAQSHVDDAVARGARVVAGGRPSSLGALFFTPTVLADVPEDARVMNEETFAPVAAIRCFDTEDDFVTSANNSSYGLAAYIFTSDARRAARLVRALDHGLIGVGRAGMTGPTVPFGGWKHSGIGREGGRVGAESFTELKYACFQAGATLG